MSRPYAASLVIASQGKQEAELVNTAYGEIRSRDGANLKFTANDAKGVFQKWIKTNRHLPTEAHVYLENPTKSEVKNAFSEINGLLSQYPQEKTGIDIYFAGHGEFPTGSLVLRDENLHFNELLDLISEPIDITAGSRGFSLMLDSCYSGSFLIDIVVALEKKEFGVKLLDAFTSSMHNEKSWELSFLEHGAFTFTFLNPGNQYVMPHELTKAIEEDDQRMLAKFLQGMVGMLASPVAFLTKARQHSISCSKGYNGYQFSINGLGSFSLSNLKEINRELIIEKFDKAKLQM